jgi:hypothetical protein
MVLLLVFPDFLESARPGRPAPDRLRINCDVSSNFAGNHGPFKAFSVRKLTSIQEYR